MKITVYSAVWGGQRIVPVSIEVSTTRAMLPRFTLLGLSGKRGEECKQRILSALRQSGIQLPHTRLIVSVLPVEATKIGTSLDLAIALAILQMYQFIPTETSAALGELGLQGEIRPCSGMYGLLGFLLDQSCEIWMPPLELPTPFIARYESKMKPISCLRELIAVAQHSQPLQKTRPNSSFLSNRTGSLPTHYSQGLLRVLELCLAGNHHLLLIGSPGIGKSHTKQVIENVLPTLSFEQSWERQQALPTMSWQPDKQRVVTVDQTATPLQLLGNEKKLGILLSLQHGVLFLDELPLFRPIFLQTLRSLFENRGAFSQPSFPQWWPNFVAVATCNPCPCSYAGSKQCHCSEEQVQKYFKQISGPLWDRFDLCWRVGTQDIKPMSASDWQNVRQRIQTARHRQEERARRTPGLPQFAGQYQWEHLTACFVHNPFFETCVLQQGSWRKSLQQARIACTLADLQQEDTTSEHGEKARFFQMKLP